MKPGRGAIAHATADIGERTWDCGSTLLGKAALVRRRAPRRVVLNFLLPRLVPGNPVDAIIAQLGRAGRRGRVSCSAIHEHYMAEFGLDQPMWKQFLIYLGNLFHGRPRHVASRSTRPRSQR